jgi:hypothetical protein
MNEALRRHYSCQVAVSAFQVCRKSHKIQPPSPCEGQAGGGAGAVPQLHLVGSGITLQRPELGTFRGPLWIQSCFLLITAGSDGNSPMQRPKSKSFSVPISWIDTDSTTTHCAS